MPEAIQDLIDINELSRRISIPKGTIYNWVYLKRIPFVKAGRSLRLDPDEVIRPMPDCAKSEKAGLRDDEWRTVRGA